MYMYSEHERVLWFVSSDMIWSDAYLDVILLKEIPHAFTIAKCFALEDF